MQTCRHIRKKLSAYQDGEVEPAEKDAIEAHLRTCNACWKEHEALIHTYEIFMSLPDMEPSPWLSSRITEKVIRADEPAWVRVLGEALRLVPAPASMATLAIVGLLGGALLGNMLIDARGKLWFIDHTRSFHKSSAIEAPERIIWCERRSSPTAFRCSSPTRPIHLGPFNFPKSSCRWSSSMLSMASRSR